MRQTLESVPLLLPFAKTAATVGGAYILGRILGAIVTGRLAAIARRSSGEWDNILIRALSRRIPLWSVLAGAWLSLGYWDLSERWVRLATRVVTALALGSMTLTAASVVTGLMVIYGRRALPGVQVSGLTQNIVRLVIVSFGVLAILNDIGVEIRPMLAALGVGGLAVALALQDPLSNLFAGVFVTMSGNVRIGDFVRIDTGIEGRVTDFNWRSTSLALPAGSTAVVPNAKLAQAIVTNFDLPTGEVAVPVDIVVDYDSDAAEVEQLALGVARLVQTTVEGALPSHDPVVRFSAFGDIGLRATVVLRAKTLGDQPLVRHEFVRRLHGVFRDRGIVIPTTVPPPAK